MMKAGTMYGVAVRGCLQEEARACNVRFHDPRVMHAGSRGQACTFKARDSSPADTSHLAFASLL